jgi:type IV secretory pathway VirB3-like protein
MDAEAPASNELRSASCEPLATRPHMLLGLPRTLAGSLAFGCLMALLMESNLKQYATTFGILGVTWSTVKFLVASDLWGFDIFIAWCITDLTFLDRGGRSGWGGARVCALPLRPASEEASHAAR